jgi:hypothetical protein
VAETLTYGITLDSGKLVSSADAAADALDDLNASIKADQQAAADAQKALKLLGKETAANKEHFQRLKGVVEGSKEKISAAALDVQKLGGAFKINKKPANDFRSTLQSIGRDAKDAGGPFGRAAGMAEKFGKTMGTTAGRVALGATAVVAGVALLAVGAMKAFNAAFEVAEKRDKELRDLGGFLSLQKGVKNFQEDGKALQGIVGRIAHNSAASRESVGSVAKQLISAGISGKQLESALEAANMASVVAGDEGVKQFIEQSKAAKAHGQSVESVATAFRQKYGDAAKGAMLTSDALSKRWQDNMDSMFEGVDFGPLQEAKKRLIDLFDAASPMGKEIRGIIQPFVQWMSNLFASMVDGLAEFIRDWVLGFKYVQLYWLKFETMFYTGLSVIADFVSDVIDGIGRSWKKLISWIDDLKLAWQQFDAKQLGMDIINGILAGLTAGWEALKTGITSLGNSISDQFKSVLGIASPSKVFAELGKQLPRGLEVGIRAEQPSVERAVEQMVPVSMNSVPRAQSAAPVITISAPISINSTGNIEQDVASLEAQLTAALSRVAQQLGAAVA